MCQLCNRLGVIVWEARLDPTDIGPVQVAENHDYDKLRKHVAVKLAHYAPLPLGVDVYL